MNSVHRILLCCEHYSPSVGGVQEVMRQIAERLAASGLEVTIATSSHPARPVETVRNGVRVLSFPIQGNLVSGMQGPLEAYRRLLRQGNFDALLIKAAQQWTFDAAINVLPDLCCRKFFIPCGFSGLYDPRYHQYFEKMPNWLRMFDGLIFYSDDYQDIAFARRHGLTRLHCLPNGIDEREFVDADCHGIYQCLGIPEEHDLLLSVGSLLAAKGHWEVMRAFAQARLNRPATLVINGNTPGAGSSAVLKRTIKHALSGRWPLSLEARWHGLTGANTNKRVLIVDLPRAELIDLYKAADLFVFASHVEYSPLVLFEAAAAGTPFLASPAGNSQEIAAWTGAGQVMPAKGTGSAAVSVTELAQQLESMLADRSHCLPTMGDSGRAAIFANGFTWERIVERYRELLCNNAD